VPLWALAAIAAARMKNKRAGRAVHPASVELQSKRDDFKVFLQTFLFLHTIEPVKGEKVASKVLGRCRSTKGTGFTVL
jgi:hypothetical protein